jgi:hypothetical protein
MRSARWLALGALLLGLPAGATAVELGLGADWWLWDRYDDRGRGVFSATLGVRGQLARRVSLGGRFGGLITSGPNYFGAPIDLTLRVHVAESRVYLEGMAGPWILFNSGAPLRFHGAFGFGLQASWVTFGFELGWLDPTAIAGVRVAFRL